jgi:hypothetical protein
LTTATFFAKQVRGSRDFGSADLGDDRIRRLDDGDGPANEEKETRMIETIATILLTKQFFI